MGRDASRRTSCRPGCNFNPRARVGRDRVPPLRDTMNAISIHAPAWGATRRREQVAFRRNISIHAPAWGATRASDCRRAALRHFNPRARVGRDSPPPCRWESPWDFNPRARVGRDLPPSALPMPPSRFQSTRPRGARRPNSIERARDILISIHAPAWGATMLMQSPFSTTLISIHAPAWGATILIRVYADNSIFQSTRPRGARHSLELQSSTVSTFQSTRPRGARHCSYSPR